MKQWQIFLMAGLFLVVCNSLGDAEAAASPVVMMSDISSADVMVDDDTGSYFAEAQLTLSSTDITYRKMETYMVSNWPSGVAWTTYFLDEDYNELANNTVEIHKAGVTVVKLVVVCDGVGSTEEGAWAANIPCARMRELYLSQEKLHRDVFVRSILEIDWELRGKGRGKAACTMVLLWIHPPILFPLMRVAFVVRAGAITPLISSLTMRWLSSLAQNSSALEIHCKQ